MRKILIALFSALLLSASQVQAYSEVECKKSMDDFDMLLESKELNEISVNVIDIARRLDQLGANANTDFFIGGIYGHSIAVSALHFSYALKLAKQVDRAKLNAINNDELFKIRATSFAKSFEPAINTVANHFVVEKNAAARDELGKLKAKLETMSRKYSSCK